MSDDELVEKYIEERENKEWFYTLTDNQQLEYKKMIIKTIDFAFFRLNYAIKNLKINIKGE